MPAFNTLHRAERQIEKEFDYERERERERQKEREREGGGDNVKELLRERERVIENAREERP